MKTLLSISSKLVWASALFFFLSANFVQAQWYTDPFNPHIVHTQDIVGINTNQPDLRSKLQVNGGIKLGGNPLPSNRWNDQVITLSTTGILGSQGSYGVSLAWNGYRRSAASGNSWDIIGTGRNRELRNVGSFEINNLGMFWYYDKNPRTGFAPTPRLSIDTDGTVNAKTAFKVGNAALPLSRWSNHVIAVSPVGLLGTQGSYGLSMTWNGYRSNSNGSWRVIGTGPNRTHRNVGSIEMKNTGIFFNFDQNPSNEFTPTARLIVGASGDVEVKGKLTTKILTITGGADLAEPFPISNGEYLPAGSVVSIDPHHPGELQISQTPYDKKVVGIISGAEGINPGIVLTQTDKLPNGQNVALSGRVYVKANTSNGIIEPGDLLTTSNIQGEAMKSTNRNQAFGAIIGKAMTGLSEKEGYVLVLVSLQ